MTFAFDTHMHLIPLQHACLSSYVELAKNRGSAEVFALASAKDYIAKGVLSGEGDVFNLLNAMERMPADEIALYEDDLRGEYADGKLIPVLNGTGIHINGCGKNLTYDYLVLCPQIMDFNADIPLSSRYRKAPRHDIFKQAMQILDESGVSPYRTFDSISRFAELLAASRAEIFVPRISTHQITDDTLITLIEPPCGSNTAIIRSGGEYLFIDTGYACYQDEMLSLFRTLIPEFDRMEKKCLITHADVDHCGLLPLFDRVYVSAKTAECLRAESSGGDGFREQNPLHKPYVRICKVLTSYTPVHSEKIKVIGAETDIRQMLEQTGSFDFGELHFELYEGKGGHLAGESVLIDFAHQLAFTGDIFVNLKDMTAQQAQYNRYAPILMTSVDTDAAVCAQERQALFARLGAGTWQIFGGHGGMKLYQVAPASV